MEQRKFQSGNRHCSASASDSIFEHQEAVLRKLCDGLADRGVLIFTSGGIDSPDERTNPCMGQPLYHAALGIAKLLEIIMQANCVCRHLEYDQADGETPGEHLYVIVQKSKLPWWRAHR